jgi:AcrR family transcriptional regulator
MPAGPLEKTRLTRAQSAAATKKALLSSALTTFLRDGFAGASIESIAERAGFSRGAFYAHFGSKEDVFLEVVGSEASKVAPILIARIDAAADVHSLIQALADWAQERSETPSLAMAMFEVVQQARRAGQLDERYASLFRNSWHSVGKALERFVPQRRLPFEMAEITALIVALTYSPIVNGVGGHTARRLVQMSLTALLDDPPPQASSPA